MIPKTLILSTLLLNIQGCYQDYHHSTRNPFEAVVGPRDSSAPLKVGVSSKDDVVKRLGQPYLHDDQGTVFGYYEYVNAGVGIWWPILIPVHGGSIQPIQAEYGLLLRFSRDSILTEYQFVLPDEGHYYIYLEQPFDEFKRKAGPTTQTNGGK